MNIVCLGGGGSGGCSGCGVEGSCIGVVVEEESPLHPKKTKNQHNRRICLIVILVIK